MRVRQACLIMVVGAAVIAGGSFLHWFSHLTFWQVWRSTNFKILDAICVVLALGSAALWLFSPAARQRRSLPRLAACAGLVGAGAAAAVDLSFRQIARNDFGLGTPKPAIGYWLTLLGAVALALGGLIALLAEGAPVPATAGPAAAGAGAPSAGAQPAPAAQPTPVPVSRPAPVSPPPAAPVAPKPTPVAAQPVSPQPIVAERLAETRIDMADPVPVGAPEAGWYDDPSGQYTERYWDGRAWTERTR